MPQRLSEKYARIGKTFDGTEKSKFFGIYVADMENFRFNKEERKIINELVRNCTDFNMKLLSPTQENKITLKLKTIGNWFSDQSDTLACHPIDEKRVVKIIAPNDATNLLSKIIKTGEKNALRPKHGFRYEDDIKKFAVYNRTLSGPLGYNSLQYNLPGCLPTISATNKFIHRSDHAIVEGVLRCEELLIYLRERNQPMWVSLSEDATRIENRIKYDVHTNQILGFVLPTDLITGMPIPFIYRARSAKEILDHFMNDPPMAKFVNTIMAQPLGNAAPFCLLIFGSDNKYTSEDVSRRWCFISKQLNDIGIGVLTVSSDSDPKYNSAMRKNSLLGIESLPFSKNGVFKCGVDMMPPYYVQDYPHIGTKARNLLAKTKMNENALPFGKFFIRLQHIKEVQQNFSKDLHFLTDTTLNETDRQNFDSVLKICDSKVINLLKKVKDSQGTSMYLQMISNVIAPSMDKESSPIQRIKMQWYSLFIVRIWREFILKTPGFTLKENFMSSFCYYCIELNAHSLIHIIIFLKKNNLTDLFLPYLFSSQPCESFYRQIRSFTSTYSTVANCDMKEITSRISKIQIQNEISNDKNSGLKFPTSLRSCDFSELKFQNSDFPTDDQIINIIQKCKTEAIADAIKVGLIDKRAKLNDSCFSCPVPPHNKNFADKEIDEEIAEKKLKDFDFDYEAEFNQITSSLKNFANQFTDKKIQESSSYVEIPNENSKVVVKKSSMCWFLRKESTKCSSDRKYRVMDK